MGLLGITTISLADSPSSWLLGNIGPLGNRKRQGERSFGIIITVDLQSNCRGDNKELMDEWETHICKVQGFSTCSPTQSLCRMHPG